MSSRISTLTDWFAALPSAPQRGTVILVDGGGSGSRAALATTEGEVLGYAEGAPTSRALGDARTTQNLLDLLNLGIKPAGLDLRDVSACLVASAAVDTVAHSRIMVDRLHTWRRRLRFRNWPGGITRIFRILRGTVQQLLDRKYVPSASQHMQLWSDPGYYRRSKRGKGFNCIPGETNT